MYDPLFLIPLGIIIGIITGLLPSIHINLIAALFLSFSLPFSPEASAVLIIVIATTHILTEIIPTTYLGVPDDELFIIAQPAQQLTKEGRATEAITSYHLGTLLGMILLLPLIPLFLLVLPPLYPLLIPLIPYLLLLFSLYLILRAENPLIAIVVFILAGYLGLITLHVPLKEPLLPLLTSLFGLPALMNTLATTTTHYPQKKIPITLPPLKELKAITFLATITAPPGAIVPSIGGAHSLALASEIKELKTKALLMLQGATTLITFALSFATLLAINKARTGTAAFIQQTLSSFTLLTLIKLTTLILITLVFLLPLLYVLTKLLEKIIQKINYKRLALLTLLFILTLNTLIAGPISLLILVAGTSIGLYALKTNTRPINLLSALLIPTILNYLV